MPVEQSRWNQANIDSLFYAGAQNFVNRFFGYTPTSSTNNYYFNLIQQPVNMITGYERQHRKGFMCQGVAGGDDQTCDQYTKLLTHTANIGGIHEQKSKAKELAAISGMVMAQPYLDYTGDDQAQGSLKLKIWEYNSFLVDPYFRNPDMSDANFVWFQEYISKNEAKSRFPDKVNLVKPILGSPQRFGDFYFLPENYNMARNDLMVLSYIWMKTRRKKKRLYSEKRNQFFDFSGGDGQLDQILSTMEGMEEVTVEVPTWKLYTVLNDQLMFSGYNPLGLDTPPCVAYFWNYDPHINYFDLRVRGLIRTMRDPQFLFNYKVIQNNDIAAATINAGWKRKVGAVANEDNLKKSGQGWDVIINDGYEMTDVEKIIPSAVPESDLALAQQMADLVYSTSGINLENWSGQQDKQVSSLTVLLKQAANLMVFQKYFDQWDYSDMLLGEMNLNIMLNNWNAEKVKLLIGEDPSPYFYSKIFAKYKVIVEESDLTPTQQNLQAQQMLDMNQQFGREVFPPSMIIPKLNITGKAEAIQYLQSQEQQQAAAMEHSTNLQHAVEEAKLKELYAKTTNMVAMAKERYGRFESNVGLMEERISEVSKNNSLSVKAKMEALEKMVDVIGRYGEIETMLKMQDIETFKAQDMMTEDREMQKAHQMASMDEFTSKMMNGLTPPQQASPGM
jgi:hypothetical protein